MKLVYSFPNVASSGVKFCSMNFDLANLRLRFVRTVVLSCCSTFSRDEEIKSRFGKDLKVRDIMF